MGNKLLRRAYAFYGQLSHYLRVEQQTNSHNRPCTHQFRWGDACLGITYVRVVRNESGDINPMTKGPS